MPIRQLSPTSSHQKFLWYLVLAGDHTPLSLLQLSSEVALDGPSREQMLTGRSGDTAVMTIGTDRFRPGALKGEMCANCSPVLATV